MNFAPNFKIERLTQKLVEIDSAINRSFICKDDQKVRALIDSRRNLLALLTAETSAVGIKMNDATSSYAPIPGLVNQIDAWCDRIKRIELSTVSYQNLEFCDLMLDHILPKCWNFDNDVIIIHQPQSTHLFKAVQNRGQKHIIAYITGDGVHADLKTFATKNKIKLSTSIQDLERTISLLQTRAQNVISISCDQDTANAKGVKTAITDAVTAGKRTRIENTVTASKFGKSWAINLLKNLPKFQGRKNLHQLSITGVEDAVIVASGPSLGKNINQLRDIKDKVFIITALRSLPVLNAAGIEADLVVQLDAEDDKVAQQLSPDPLHPIKNLLLEGTVNPGFFAMPAKNIIWSLPQHFFDVHKNFGTLPTPFNVPSVSIYGLCLCQFLDFKNICFIGQDLAASHGKQYADGATDLLPAHAKMSMFQIEVPGFYGDTVLTRNSYEYQIKRCSEIAREWRSNGIDINLVNATEGGAYIPEFDHMTLDNFITRRQLNGKKTNKSVQFSAEFPINADSVKSYLLNIHAIMTRISVLADMIIKLDNEAEQTSGLQKKKRKVIQKFQELNDSTSLLQIAMQDEIAKVIGTSRTIETVDSYTNFFAKIKENATALADAAKQ